MINKITWRFKISLYNVITLNICYTLTKFITFTKDIKEVNDLRQYLIFDEIKQFGGDKLEKETFRDKFLFTFNH